MPIPTQKDFQNSQLYSSDPNLRGQTTLIRHQMFLARNAGIHKMQRHDMEPHPETAASPYYRRLRQVLLSVRPLHGSGPHAKTIRLALRRVELGQACGGDVRDRIRGLNAAWRLGSMLPQMPMKGKYFIDSYHS